MNSMANVTYLTKLCVCFLNSFKSKAGGLHGHVDLMSLMNREGTVVEKTTSIWHVQISRWEGVFCGVFLPVVDGNYQLWMWELQVATSPQVRYFCTSWSKLWTATNSANRGSLGNTGQQSVDICELIYTEEGN